MKVDTRGMRLVAALMAAALGGCSALPAAGPTNSAFTENATPAGAQSVNPSVDYELISLEEIIDAGVRPQPRPTLGSLADGKGPVALRIGIGDLVRVSIWEAGSGGLFSSSAIAGVAAGSATANIPDQIVGSDGAITVPYAGRVRVAGQSPEAVERTIVTRLTGKAIEPQVLVTVTRGVSSTVTVTGDVAAGAQIPLMPNGQRVLDIIALAGGLRGPAHETMVALKRGNRTVEVPFTKLARSPSENIFMRPNDTLILSRRPMTFVALGATGANAEIPMGEESIVLTNAIAKAGGLLDFRADASGVFILRREMSSNVLAVRPNSRLALSGPEVNVVYKVDMRDPRHLVAAQTFHVRMGDVLYVPNAFAADAQKVLNLFNTTVAPVVTGISAANAAQSLAN